MMVYSLCSEQKGLTKGEYQLKIYEPQTVIIRIRVAGSKSVRYRIVLVGALLRFFSILTLVLSRNYAVADNILLEMKNRNPLQITEVVRNEDESAVITLAGHTDKVLRLEEE